MRSCRGSLPSWLAARGLCCCRDVLGLWMELQPPACGLRTGPQGSEAGLVPECSRGLSPKGVCTKGCFRAREKPFWRRGWRSRRRELPFPLRTCLASTPKPQWPAAPTLLGRYAVVITAAPWGNGIFICAVITAAHPRQRAQREQGKRQWGACPPSSRHTRRITQAVSSRHSLSPALTHSHTHTPTNTLIPLRSGCSWP